MTSHRARRAAQPLYPADSATALKADYEARLAALYEQIGRLST
jgi:hypothetical protein